MRREAFYRSPSMRSIRNIALETSRHWKSLEARRHARTGRVRRLFRLMRRIRPAAATAPPSVSRAASAAIAERAHGDEEAGQRKAVDVHDPQELRRARPEVRREVRNGEIEEEGLIPPRQLSSSSRSRAGSHCTFCNLRGNLCTNVRDRRTCWRGGIGGGRRSLMNEGPHARPLVSRDGLSKLGRTQGDPERSLPPCKAAPWTVVPSAPAPFPRLRAAPERPPPWLA